MEKQDIKIKNKIQGKEELQSKSAPRTARLSAVRAACM